MALRKIAGLYRIEKLIRDRPVENLHYLLISLALTHGLFPLVVQES